jgi:hypothetical protein
MNLHEAGAIPGVAVGAIVGGIICKSHGVLAAVGGSLVGAVSGGIFGFIYACVMIILMATIGILWSAARRRSDVFLGDIAYAQMSRFAQPGVFFGVLIGGLLIMNWRHALIAMLVMLVVISIAAVAFQQFDRTKKNPQSQAAKQ